MRQLKYIFTALAAMLLATSCSKEELLTDYDGNGTDEPGQMQTYTFTVSPDLTMEGDAETRSEGTQEEMPTRCFMQILGDNVSQDVQQGEPIENGSFTFSVKLPNTTYTFLFWADNGSGDTPTDLREVQYTPGTVAFAAKVIDTPENMIENEVSLKHAVAKLTLQTTAATSAGEGESIKVTTTCATTYNVDNPSASSYSEQTTTKTFDASTDFAINDNIATFYFIPTDEAQDVDVEFHLLKQTIESVPLAANAHVTLQGDMSENNLKWGATSEYAQEQIDRFFKDDNGNHKGAYSLDTDCYEFNINRDKIDDLAKVSSEILHKNIQIDLEGLTNAEILVNEKFDDDHLFLCQYNALYVDTYISIYINSISFPTYIIYIDNTDSTLPDFSVVSNELNQSTE